MKILEFQQWSIFERNTVKYASRDGEKKNSKFSSERDAQLICKAGT